MKQPTRLPKKGGYVSLQDWMVRYYNLSLRELIVYAVIHSFSQDGKSSFTGSIQYLSFWTRSGKTTILKTLKDLIAKGLIAKEEIYTEALPRDLSKEKLAEWKGKHRHYCRYWSVFSRLSEEEQDEIITKVPYKCS